MPHQAYARYANELRLNQIFFNKYAKPQDDWDWRQYGAKLLGSVSGCRVLDYGCGQGEESVYLAKMGAHVTAIDISPVGVRLTNERARLNVVWAIASTPCCQCVVTPPNFQANPSTWSTDSAYFIKHRSGALA